MKKLLTAVIAATMLVPTGALASSIRPGSHGTIKPRAPKGPSCLVEEKWKPCEVVIDETGVIGPEGHITDVVQWTTEEKEFNVAGGIVGGAAGGKGTGKFFTVIGDDAQGNRIIQEIYYSTGKAARKASKDLLNTTKLVEGESR